MFSNQEYIVYLKRNTLNIKEAPQTDENHYSVEIPSKKIEDYKMLKSFSSFDQLKKWIKSEHSISINEDKFYDKKNRDIFGDFICPLPKGKKSLAIRQAGDFLLYFSSQKKFFVQPFLLKL